MSSSKSLIARGLAYHAVGAGVTVLLIGAVYGVVHVPSAHWQSAQARTAQACRAFLAEAPNIRAELDSLQQQHAATERQYANLRRRIPDAAYEAEFLAELATLASETGFALHHYRPGQVRTVGSHHELEIQLSLAGSHEGLCRFLLGLESLERFCRISELAISPQPETQDYACRMTVQIFFATATETQSVPTEIAAHR